MKNKEPDNLKTIKLFIVACTKYHDAVGPFASAKIAIAVSRKMTESSKTCDFIAMPLFTEGLLGPLDPRGQGSGQESSHPGTYL